MLHFSLIYREWACLVTNGQLQPNLSKQTWLTFCYFAIKFLGHILKLDLICKSAITRMSLKAIHRVTVVDNSWFDTSTALYGLNINLCLQVYLSMLVKNLWVCQHGPIHCKAYQVVSNRPSDITRWCDFTQLTSNRIRSHNLRKLYNS